MIRIVRSVWNRFLDLLFGPEDAEAHGYVSRTAPATPPPSDES